MLKEDPIDGSERMQSRWMRVDGMRIHTRVSTIQHPPARLPVVCVHGLGVSGTYMIPTAALLAKHYHVYVPDLPGFGDSGTPRNVPDLRGLADALVAWMDAMELGPAALVGNSMGCQVAVHAAVDHPDRVARLVLQGPTIDPAARTVHGQMIRLLADALLEPPSMTVVAIRDYLKCGPARMLATLRHSLRDPIEEKLPLVDIPTLVVRGARDPIVPQRWAETAARLLPQGRLIVLPGAAHAINYAQPRELAREVRQFLTGGDNSRSIRRSGATGGDH